MGRLGWSLMKLKDSSFFFFLVTQRQRKLMVLTGIAYKNSCGNLNTAELSRNFLYDACKTVMSHCWAAELLVFSAQDWVKAS
jgi:hypothetical protein